jgi:hypothetical protein
MPLEDGTPTRYAMGLGLSGEGEHRVLAHGGGINGFLSDGRYYPEADLTIIVLQNSTGPQGPGALGQALAEAILGPEPTPREVPFQGELDALLGRYGGPARGRALTVEVTRDGDALVFRTEGASEGVRPLHLEGLVWGLGNTRFRFLEESGRISGLQVDQGSGLYVLGKEGE